MERGRQRRLRSTLMHERQTVAMELGAVHHHSRGVGFEHPPTGTEDSKRGSCRVPRTLL